MYADSPPSIHRIDLRSALLADASYDMRLRALDVAYTDGNAYRFYDVPHDTWVAFCAAESRGRFFLDFIRENYSRERKP
jgi:hypothetical protein